MTEKYDLSDLVDDLDTSKQPKWVIAHLRAYLESGGKQGHLFDAGAGNNPLPTLLLTTRGRKSGKKRMSPLVYGVFEGNHIIVGSKGGAETHTGWYFNLLDHPEAEIQVGTARYKVRARIASGPERARIWAHMLTVFPTYGDYQKKTDREIPVFVLETQPA
ncbi:MAG TPA: nitroreductase family deazaflavin-dependent oxidoreductase [Alphaproteobacteria bacterium]|nr:nitroreductase family deazaflavin-dependent oxidoreductase [Alphaproteobacteria bacterium]